MRPMHSLKLSETVSPQDLLPGSPKGKEAHWIRPMGGWPKIWEIGPGSKGLCLYRATALLSPTSIQGEGPGKTQGSVYDAGYFPCCLLDFCLFSFRGFIPCSLAQAIPARYLPPNSILYSSPFLKFPVHSLSPLSSSTVDLKLSL